MHQGPYEIVILRPTPVFLAFLAAQLPEEQVPALQLLQTDCTAYVIRKQTSEEATLEEIEQHFPAMFKHEIGRWLGANASNVIETRFLDFLCCFKFELHSHLILMERSIQQGHQLLTIKPRTQLFAWMKSTVEEDELLHQVMERSTLAQLTENATVLIKNFSHLNEIKPFLQQYYKPLYETAMSRMSNQQQDWPVVASFKTFSQYFAIEIHTQLIHLPLSL